MAQSCRGKEGAKMTRFQIATISVFLLFGSALLPPSQCSAYKRYDLIIMCVVPNGSMLFVPPQARAADCAL
jgi:hypothetical protein